MGDGSVCLCDKDKVSHAVDTTSKCFLNLP